MPHFFLKMFFLFVNCSVIIYFIRLYNHSVCLKLFFYLLYVHIFSPYLITCSFNVVIYLGRSAQLRKSKFLFTNLKGHNPAQVNAMVQNAKKPDASAVANVLAARGITVTPASSRKSSTDSNQTQNQQAQQQSQQQTQQMQISTLNLSSAISIIPTGQKKQQEQQQQGQFAVPQNKNKQANEVERPPRPPTVDLTQDTPLSPMVRRGRPPRWE